MAITFLTLEYTTVITKWILFGLHLKWAKSEEENISKPKTAWIYNMNYWPKKSVRIFYLSLLLFYISDNWSKNRMDNNVFITNLVSIRNQWGYFNDQLTQTLSGLLATQVMGFLTKAFSSTHCFSMLRHSEIW